MDVNLFSQIDSSVEEGVKNDFYGKVLEKRQRPGIEKPEEVEPVFEPEIVSVPESEPTLMTQPIIEKPAKKTRIPVPKSGCLAINANGIAIITNPIK